jgi:hypothetical protein
MFHSLRNYSNVIHHLSNAYLLYIDGVVYVLLLW